MQPGDRAEFERILAELCAALDKPVTDAKREAFWKGLSKMSLIEFSRCRDRLLEELSDGELRKYFAVNDVWAARKRLRARAPDAHEREAKWLGSKSLARVNQMFLRWLVHEIPKRTAFIDRNGKPRSIPDAELAERLKAVSELAIAHECLLADGSDYATEVDLQSSFTAAMGHIKRRAPEQLTGVAA